MFPEKCDDGLGVDVHDCRGLFGLGFFALHAHAGDDLLADGEGLAEKLGLPGRVAHLAAEGLVGEVVGAQAVAVAQQDGFIPQFDARRLGKKL
jgi:hypothetical protein